MTEQPDARALARILAGRLGLTQHLDTRLPIIEDVLRAAEARAQEAEKELADLKRHLDRCDLDDFYLIRRLKRQLAKARRTCLCCDENCQEGCRCRARAGVQGA